jgi:hypothetical protein
LWFFSLSSGWRVVLPTGFPGKGKKIKTGEWQIAALPLAFVAFEK